MAILWHPGRRRTLLLSFGATAAALVLIPWFTSVYWALLVREGGLKKKRSRERESMCEWVSEWVSECVSIYIYICMYVCVCVCVCVYGKVFAYFYSYVIYFHTYLRVLLMFLSIINVIGHVHASPTHTPPKNRLGCNTLWKAEYRFCLLHYICLCCWNLSYVSPIRRGGAFAWVKVCMVTRACYWSVVTDIVFLITGSLHYSIARGQHTRSSSFSPCAENCWLWGLCVVGSCESLNR